jgi:hypothetical protein
MTFDEFFKKKRIDLAALESAEPALFLEFKAHYEQMGEKSFDHTKKYWFNKIRRQFLMPVEVKTEKVKIENQLAEQTVTESLVEDTATPKAPPSPKLGFVPKFKAASPPKPTTEEITQVNEPGAEDKPAIARETPAEDTTTTKAPSPKLGFVPKFKAASPPKPANEPDLEEKQAVTPETPAEDTATTKAPSPKLGFVPKFKAASPPKPAAEEKKPAIEPDLEEKQAVAPETPAEDKPAPPAYKPRFNMKNIPPKPPAE